MSQSLSIAIEALNNNKEHTAQEAVNVPFTFDQVCDYN